MTERGLSTPVAMFIFNRPDTTARVFEAVRRARPRQLLLIADGPRASRPNEAELCARTRAITAAVDWDCQVLRAFSDQNLGCRRRFATGLAWLFEQVEEAIILEDDTLPGDSFFPFCEELLARYRDDPRVGMIVGTSFLGARHRPTQSYYFSKYPYIWGWASWRRAFRSYDADMQTYPEFVASGDLARACDVRGELRYWKGRFDQAYAGKADTWDYQMVYALWRHQLLCAVPEQNLVSNIGFAEGATHLALGDDETANLPVHELGALIHPARVERDLWADRYVFKRIYQGALRRVVLHLRKGYERGGLSGLRSATVDLAQRTYKLLTAP
jgi:hypothetical protein